jgi:hypothetical protein
MERAPKHVTRTFRPLRIYREDVEAIYSTMSEHTAKIELETQGYKITTLSDLGELPEKQTNELRIFCRDPYVNLEVTGSSPPRIYAAADDTTSRGLVDKVSDILKPRQRSWLWTALRSAWFMWLPINIGSWGALFAARYEQWAIFSACVVIAVLGAVWIRLVWVWRFSHYSEVVFLYRRDAPSFFARNRDPLAIAVIGALIGVLGTVVVVLISK